MLFFCIMVSLSDQRRKIFSSLRTQVIMMYNLFILMLLPLMHKRSFPWFSFNSELIFTTLPVFSLHLWSVFMDVLPHSNIQEILPLLLFGEWARRPCRWRKFPISWLSETSLMAQQVKNPPMRQEAQKKGFDPWFGNIPWRKKWQSTPVFLPGKIPRTEEPGGLQSVGLQRLRHDWAAAVP